MKVIYVSGPIAVGTSRFTANLAAGLAATRELLRRGYLPLSPFLHCLASWTDELDYEQWMAVDFEMVRLAECVVRLPGESPGGDREVRYAQSLGKPVYFGLEQVPALAPPSAAPEPV